MTTIEQQLHQLIGSYILKFYRSPQKIAINSEAYQELDERIKTLFAGLLVPDYFLPYNKIEAL